ncbi:hypothetical protein Atai01_45710 [Amycolatopsis taiwanensis]|uniref:Orc1-like AAA ATPase domain-containing protein n=1 Tax=Amycolatopsis taiwanensis TaxID=342230 RepID=A0A9W6R5F0_9PSEU|nr:hypothetical protein Atai01_45710 [Amycolatopsis taiwanensis]
MSRLVGRDAELAYLRRSVRQEPGTPRALLLLGEEGVGKTTLLRADKPTPSATSGLTAGRMDQF